MPNPFGPLAPAVASAPKPPKPPAADASLTTTGAMSISTVMQPTTSAELPRDAAGDSVVGAIVAVPLAPANGDIPVQPGTPVAVVAQGFFQNPTFRLAIAIMGGALAFFLGYVADQSVQLYLGVNLPWFLDTTIVIAFGLGVVALVYFWHDARVVKGRTTVYVGGAASAGYVLWTVYQNGGLSGLDWSKTWHAALNAGLVALIGAVFARWKIFDNNPLANQKKA